MRKKRGKIIALAIVGVLVLALLFGALYIKRSDNPRSRILLSTLHFAATTLEDPGYLLYGIDIMDLCRNYANGDIEFNGKVSINSTKQVKSSIFMEVDGRRSFSQKRLAAGTVMSLLWVEAGDIDIYAEDETVYMDAPLLGDFGYAFPTGLNLFAKMPDLTSDIDQKWFKDNAKNIVDLTGSMGLVETGNIYTTDAGVEAEEYIITIPEGQGGFVWELLGMEPPKFDVVTSLYLTKDNRLVKMDMDLDDFLPGGYMSVYGDKFGECFFSYELPEDERIHMHISRNLEYPNRMDAEVIYFTNTGSKMESTCYLNWMEQEEGFEIKVKDLLMKNDGKKTGEGYFIGNVKPIVADSDVWEGVDERLYGLEELDWRAVRDDAEAFTNEVMEKIKRGGL